MIELWLKWWCRHFHKQLLRPVHGEYRCAVCLRTWPVPWELPPVDRIATIPLRDHPAAQLREGRSKSAVAGYR